jgi:hypothetical protein
MNAQTTHTKGSDYKVSMNMAFEAAQESHSEFISLMEAQNRWAQSSIESWLTHKPWTYGSIDSADYHEAALRLAADMTNVMLEGDHDAWMLKCSRGYLWENFACDGICPELWKKFPDPEEA